MRVIRVAFVLILALAALVPFAAGPALAQAAAEPAADPVADPVRLLLEVLNDDAARARLVEQLEAATAEAAPETAPETAAVEEPVSVARRLAGFSERMAEHTATWGSNLGAAVRSVPRAFSGLRAADVGIVWDALRDLLLILVVTAGAFVALRTMAMPFYRRIGQRAAGQPFRRRIGPFVFAGAVDFAIVGVAWLVGNGVALLVFAEQGQVARTQALYLTAFLAVELVKAAFRLLLSPATRALRPAHMTDWAARRLYRVIRVVASILGYGFLLVVPIISGEAGFFASRSTVTLIWVIAILYMVGVVLRYRRPVGDWLLRQLDRAPSGAAAHPLALAPAPVAAAGDAPPPDAAAAEATPAGGMGGRDETVRMLAHGWSWLALAWLAWLLVTVIQQRTGAVAHLLENSGRVVIALVAAFTVSGLLGRWVTRGIHLPQTICERVPLLERRLNQYVPWFLLVVRLLIVVGVLVYAAVTLGLVSPSGRVLGIVGPDVAGRVFSVMAIILVGFLLWLALSSWVEYRLNSGYGSPPSAREQTLLTLLRSAGTIAILALMLMFVLSELGLNIGPLLASAGVVGLAIGFGAQKMVQDIINGIFIQFEKAINVGDVVSAGGITGSVERLTVRSVSLRDVDGVYHIIPFSSVDTVSNFMRDFSNFVMDMRVAYRENVDDVKQALHDAFAELRADPEQGAFILGDLEWFGVNALVENAVVVRVRIRTWPGKQWGVGRAYNGIVKRVFDERGIEIPFPQRTVWLGEDRKGEAPPLRVARHTPPEE